jgi:glycosyltransferase involved in cell wall biosynthesis
MSQARPGGKADCRERQVGGRPAEATSGTLDTIECRFRFLRVAMRPDVVAVIPAFGCAGTVGRVVSGCRGIVGRVVVVDDGSGDATAHIAREAGAVVEVLPANRGKGFALRRGISIALRHRPAAVALLDGDGQHDPRDLTALLAAWDAGVGDLIIGTRMGAAREIPRSRYLTNYLGSRALSWMCGVELPDSQCGYRILASGLADRLGLSADGYAIESEMLLKAVRLGARIAHVPVATIYDGIPSHFQPLRDTVRISLAAVYYKVFDGC